MKKKVVKLIAIVLIFSVTTFVLEVFIPRQYDVPQLQKRAGTKYWQLSTGSKIGYSFIAAKGTKKPYPVIYLHGGPGGAISNNIIAILSSLSNDGYDVYLYDQAGSGQSNRLANINEYTPERHVKDLEEIIQHTNADKIILIGQSWGAILAVLFTAHNTNKVAKIIFTSPGPVYPYRPGSANVKAPDSLHLKAPYYTNAGGTQKASNIRTRAMTFYATTFGKKLAPDKEADNFADYLNYEVNKSTVCDTSKIPKAIAGAGFYAMIMTFKNLVHVQDPRPQLKNNTIPVLVLKGQCDNQLWGHTNEYLDIFPNHQLVVIANAGHDISIEQPELFLKTIRDFLTVEN